MSFLSIYSKHAAGASPGYHLRPVLTVHALAAASERGTPTGGSLFNKRGVYKTYVAQSLVRARQFRGRVSCIHPAAERGTD